MTAKILVVDDIAPNVKLLEAKLVREYFTVITAFSGAEALEKTYEEMPDVILLDVMMPGIDGFDVCKKLKSDPRTSHIPIIMVTALTDVEDRIQGLECGADEFISKPINDTALMARIRSLIRLKMTVDEFRMRQNTAHKLGVGVENYAVLNEESDGAEILLIETQSESAQDITEVLRLDGHFVTLASDGGQAVKQCQEKQPECIIINAHLGDEDGIKLVTQLRLNGVTKRVPVIVIAQDSDVFRIAASLESEGAHDYILEPVDGNELRARVKTQIRRRRFQRRLKTNYEESISMALTDELTGLYNRRYLMTYLERVLSDAARSRRSLAVMMLDIDHFKKTNDTYGHAVGDEVLKEFGDRLSRRLRSFDLIARFGGEEFVVVLPNVYRDVAFKIAHRLLSEIAKTPFKVSTEKESLPITCSIGAAIVDQGETSPGIVIERADKCLYEAKDAGRNCIFFEGMGVVSSSNVIAFDESDEMDSSV